MSRVPRARPPVVRPSGARPLGLLLATLVPLLAGCREGTGSAGGAVPIALPLFGAGGCDGPDQTFGSLAAVSFAQLVPGPTSQLAASTDRLADAGTYELFATGEDATVVKLVFDPADPDTPVSETVLVAPGEVDALAEYAAVSAPAELSGIAVLDPAFLVVVENTANTLLLVARDVPGSVSVFPSLSPNETPGNADGTGGLVRFSFVGGAQIVPSGDGRIFVADPGNHSVRRLAVGGFVEVATVAGTGAPFYADGRLLTTGFDTPRGLAIGCDGALLVAETGAAGQGGHRIRRLEVGDFSFFGGGFDGSSSTLLGDGTAATAGGDGGSATLDAPMAPVRTSEDELYWVDSATGILRRYDLATDAADCPLFVDCAAAVAAAGSFPNFATQGGGFALAVTEDGSLYALDADAGALWRVTP